MIKKLFTGLLVLTFLVVLAIWSPWDQWNFSFLKLIGVDNSEVYATLKVKSLEGELEIYVDQELKGTANSADADFAEITPISIGEHTVTLKRKPAAANSTAKFFELTRKINFEPGIDVVIAYDLGPSENFTEGHILYTRKNYTKAAEPLLNVVSMPEGVEVSIDGVVVGTAPLKDIQLNKNSQHKIKFTKAGYDALEITIMPEKQEGRDLLMNLTLMLEVNLFAQPLKVNNL
jgi:hypothetical protein